MTAIDEEWLKEADECPKPGVAGMRSCSTFSITPENKRFGHMFLRWSSALLTDFTRKEARL